MKEHGARKKELASSPEWAAQAGKAEGRHWPSFSGFILHHNPDSGAGEVGREDGGQKAKKQRHIPLSVRDWGYFQWYFPMEAVYPRG